MDIVFSAATVTYAGRVALHPLTLTLTERRIGVVGLNGSGKTTMARMINGLVKPTAGTVTVGGLDTVADEVAARGKTGFIFQNPQHQMILPILSEDIAFGLKNRGFGKVEIAEKLNALVARNAAVTERWITDAELDANPGLVKTMSVQPPRGSGRIRLVAIGDIDLQPCGGTHVRNTAEIGLVAVTDIEKKGKQNRRVRIALA